MKTDSAAKLATTLQTEYGLLRPILRIPEDGIESSTYIVADNIRQYIVKLYNDELQAETVAQFQSLLSAAKLPTPAILPAKSGNLTVQLGNRVMVLSEFVDGEPIGWDKEFASLSGPLTISVAEAVANIHVLSIARPVGLGTELDHPLSTVRLLGQNDHGSILDLPTSTIAHGRKAMIHGDLTRENIFLPESHDSVRAIIDFGDAHYDYITYDIAILLTQVYVTKSWGIDFKGIEEFLIFYAKINPLHLDELRAILPLMKLRNRGLLQEIEQRLAAGDADAAILESIRKSLKTKLQLLEEHGQQLESLIVGA